MKKEKIVEEGYNKIALNYHSERNKFESIIELRQFTELLTSGAKILDVGCGAGVPVTKYLVDEGFSVIGIDISEEMLSLAKKHVPKGEFLKADMSEMDFLDDSFDGIVSFYAIIHLPREKHAFLFKKFRRILKPRGIMLIGLGSSESEDTGEYFGTKMFWSHYSAEQSLELVKDAGFEIIFEEVLERGGERHYWILAKANQ
ncbi:MAG: class I SAM-dependent methyltransferase [Candidatus Heimdallarchaeota archaeon]|nr:class I SAM-dependent methyltransferase [Candidatus Heimdallarchaeota archaeon]MCK4768798.1 class I SAM-dependent methyltransferase [Candidatus Heimdallarchaeota archaeon]